MAKKGSWIVRMKCVVIKEYFIDGCTERQAKEDPFDHDIVDEYEIEQIDWDVQSVEPNE